MRWGSRLRNIFYLSRPFRNLANIQIRRCTTKRKMAVLSLFEDDDSIHKSGLMAEVQAMISQCLGIEPGYQRKPKSREHLLKYQPQPEDLPSRSIRDSLTSAIVPLSSNSRIQDKYVTILGRLRFGRLMEDIDLFAVWVCHRHIEVPTLPEGIHLPYTFVTLLVDKVEFSKVRTRATDDIRLIGHASWTGNSSIEISIWINQKSGDKWKNITKAIFLMVARNATNTGPAPVNKLKPADDVEAEIIAEAARRQKVRRNRAAASVFKVVPTDNEQLLIHNIFRRITSPDKMDLNKRVLPPNCCWMSDSSQSVTMNAYPVNRNAHNTLFGGYIMRSALQISYISALKYSKTSVSLNSILDISFHRPISLKSLLSIHAYIIYTTKNYMLVMAIVDVLDPTDDNEKTSNVIYFIYTASGPVPEVLPVTYHETMWYIHGRRKFIDSMNIKENEEQSEKKPKNKKHV